MLRNLVFALATVALAGAATPSQALPVLSGAEGSSMIIKVANGCGPRGYRGPNGACHSYGTGPYPGGYHGPYHDAALDENTSRIVGRRRRIQDVAGDHQDGHRADLSCLCT